MCLGFLKVELKTDSLVDEQEETTSDDVDGDFLINTEPSEGIAKTVLLIRIRIDLALLDPDPDPRKSTKINK
jgi:hypothetical protein